MDDLPLLDLSEVRKLREQGGTSFELYVPEFMLRNGDFVGIVGESGCGKSTFLDLLALVLKPTEAGVFRIAGPTGRDPEDVVDLYRAWQSDDEASLARIRRDQLGYVLQSGGLLPFLSLEQNIVLPLRIRGETSIDKGRLDTMVRTMGLQGVLHKKPQFLSGGQRQRGAVLRSLVHDPMIVLADEPTAAVDKPRADAIVRDLRALAQERGTAIVMVTHDRDLVERNASRMFDFDTELVSETLTRSRMRETVL